MQTKRYISCNQFRYQIGKHESTRFTSIYPGNLKRTASSIGRASDS